MKELRDVTQVYQATQTLPNILGTQIIPVIEVNPKLLRRIDILKAGSVSNGTTSTVYTTPADQDFFIVAVSLSVTKDATSTSTSSGVTCIVGGAAVEITSIAGLTLTAQSSTISVALPTPIKVDRSSNITVTNSTNVANVRARANVLGYLVNNNG